MKSNSERIANLEKSVNDLANRVGVLEDKATLVQQAVDEKKALEDAVDQAIVRLDMLGV